MLTTPLISDPIVHRMVMEVKQDHTGRNYEVVRVITASGKQVFVDEYQDTHITAEQKAEEKPLKVRLAHMWNIWNDSIQVMPCLHPETCRVCQKYSNRTRISRN